MFRRTLVLGAFAGCLARLARADETTSIDVEIQGLRSTKGKVHVALWASADGFLSDDKPAFQTQIMDARVPRVVLTFGGVRPGMYAISAFHDENSNGKLDKNLLGIPKEGYGFSNDARGRMGPPKFEAARFQAGPAPRTHVAFTMQY